MIVVSDTSAICYLVLIGQADLLQALFGEVLIPPTVKAELIADGAPEVVRAWIEAPPPWLTIRATRVEGKSADPQLHPGEREVLALAHEVRADLVLLDDGAARRRAAELDLPHTGILGILDQSAKRGLVDIKQAVAHLRNTNFRIHPNLLRRLLEKHS